jgi:hypothetical protein
MRRADPINDAVLAVVTSDGTPSPQWVSCAAECLTLRPVVGGGLKGQLRFLPDWAMPLL